MQEVFFNIVAVLCAIYAVLGVIYAGMFWALVRLTGKFLYIPHRASLGKLKTRAKEQGLEVWENARSEAIGWKRKSATAQARVLIFCGRYGMSLDKQYIVSMVGEIYGERAEICMMEYPGYGARGGVMSQDSLTAAGLEGVKLLREMGDDPIYIVGESLGAAVATQVAAKVPEEIAGMFLITPFSNLPDVAAHRYPIFPIGRFLKDRYDSCEALKNYHGKVAILVAEKDNTSPARLGKKIYDSYNGLKKLWVANGADHNDLDYSLSATCWREGFAFLES